MKSIMTVSALILLGSATAAFAQLPLPTPTPPPVPITVPVSLTVAGNEAFGSFDIGGIGADLKISFENVVGLVPSAFDVTATLVDPVALLSRLPGSGVCVPPTAGAV